MAFYHLILGRKKAGDLFQISCLVCRCVGGGYLVVKVRDKLTRCVSGKLEVLTLINSPTSLTSILHFQIVQATMTKLFFIRLPFSAAIFWRTETILNAIYCVKASYYLPFLNHSSIQCYLHCCILHWHIRKVMQFTALKRSELLFYNLNGRIISSFE